MNERAKDILVHGAAELGVKLTTGELGKLYSLAAELRKWGRKINLTAIREDDEIAIKHFLDSLTLLKFIGAKGALLDVGSGGGFPAIPLKIMRHELHVVSVDAVEKKIIFQRHMAMRFRERRFRLEILGVDPAFNHDLCICRDHEIHRSRFYLIDRRADNAAGDRHFFQAYAELLRSHVSNRRRAAEHERARHAFTTSPVFLPVQIALCAARSGNHAHPEPVWCL